MRLGVLLVGWVLMTGCATGLPPGGRVLASSYRYNPLTPVAAPREPLDDDTAPAVPTRTVSLRASSAPARARPAARDSAREEVLAAARSLVGSSTVKLGGRTWPGDCTGFVEAVYARAGVSLRGAGRSGDNGVTAFYRYAQTRGRVYTQGEPQPGDLVFFRETYDRNRDGRRNDGLTHVGLVDEVREDGTITVIHRVQRGVVRYRMNLARKDERRDARTGQVLNEMLRAPGGSKAPVLTGQLFASYGSVLPGPGPSPAAMARR